MPRQGKMKIGLIGFPQSGKKTLFQILTGTLPSNSSGSDVGISDILDARFDTLARMYEPRKETRAKINIELLPDVDSDSLREGAIFKNIADMDALCCVIRAFESETVYHIKESVDPSRDLSTISSELLLHDHLFAEKRLERIEQNKKKSAKISTEKEEALMHRFCRHLDAGFPLRTLEMTPEERAIITSYPLITLKQTIIVFNTDEHAQADSAFLEKIESSYAQQNFVFLKISALFESEIAALESEEERCDFMQSVGIKEPSINALTRACMQALGLISFFTVGKDEVKQWLIRKGSSAPEAGRAIHSDIERGFIRAEVIKYHDLITLQSEEAVKKAGKLFIMGKDYIVEDGDIISFRFNV